MSVPSDMPELPNWLAEQQALYRCEPGWAGRLLEPALAALELLDDAAPSRCGVELALHVGRLACEERNPRAVRDPLLRGVAWCEACGADELLPELLCMLARADTQAQRFESALPQFERAQTLATQRGDRVAMALALGGMAQLAHRQADMPRALALASAALTAFEGTDYVGPWVQSFATLAVAQRELGDQEGRRATLQRAAALCENQRRWGEAANMLSGLIDMALEAGEPAAAERELERAARLADLADASPDSLGQAMVQFSRARCLAARGRFAEAGELMQAALDRQEHRLVSYEFALRLQQLADWRVQAGEPERALDAVRRAHQLQQQQARDIAERDADLLRQRLALEHAETERALSARHREALAARHAALEESLCRRRELQAELVDSSKLAGLASLLAGVADALNEPLSSALLATARAAALTERLRESLAAPTVSRTRLLDELEACTRETGSAQARLQSAVELMAGYRDMEPDDVAQAPVDRALTPLIRAAWERAVPAGSALRLEIDGDVCAPVQAEALAVVLLQLFQNAERHAYAAGEAGWVRVAGRYAGDRFHLQIADGGRGIPADRLAQLFESDAMRSRGDARGLGLFVARATARRRMKGKLRCASRAGAGTSFELEWATR